MVNQLVARNGVQPDCERTAAVVRGAPLMHREQGLLHEILDIRALAAETPGEVHAQAISDIREQPAIGWLVASQRADHQGSQAFLDLLQG
jgi:hypothetical protein